MGQTDIEICLKNIIKTLKNISKKNYWEVKNDFIFMYKIVKRISKKMIVW